MNDVKILELPEQKKLDIILDGEFFASYVYSAEYAKPYLGPICISGGKWITRLDLQTKEHPHQRSFIVAVGDVNGIDFWNEPANCGIQRHAGFENIVNAGAYTSFTAKNIWHSREGVPVMEEARTFTFTAEAKKRYIDLETTFTASYGDVVFGATKEAGPLGIRIAEALRGDKGGVMVNSEGGRGEAQCWGKTADWCCYSGSLGDTPCGIAVLDNTGNERYPTAWHIRDYGLFAANNLYFKGALTIKNGGSLTYRYRIIIFEDNLDCAAEFQKYGK